MKAVKENNTYKLPTKVDRIYYKTFNMCDIAGSFTSSGWQGTDKGTNYIYGKANAYEVRGNPTVTSTYTFNTPIPARTYVYNLTVTGQENGYYNNPTVTITYENSNTEVVFSQTISTNSCNIDFSFEAKYPVKSISIQGTLTHTSVNYVWVYMTLTSKSFVSNQGDYDYYEDKTTYYAIGE